MERRRAKRRARRLRTELWLGGGEEHHVGTITNISTDGAFIATTKMLAPGTRVRLSLGEGAERCLLEAVVTRTETVPPELRLLRQGGIAVRYLLPAELVREVLMDSADDNSVVQSLPPDELDAPEPGSGVRRIPVAATAAAAPRPHAAAPVRPVEAPVRPPAASAAAAMPSSAVPRPPSSAPSLGHAAPATAHMPSVPTARAPSAATAHGSSAATARAPGCAPAPVAAVDERRPPRQVRFASESAFLDAYRKELRHGGLFITTDEPPALDDDVQVVLTVPGWGAPLCFGGRVVFRVEPAQVRGGGRPGFGVDFPERDLLKRTLEPIVGRLEVDEREGSLSAT